MSRAWSLPPTAAEAVRAVRRGLRDRWILGALLLALALRLAWVVWATDTSIDPFSDEAQYLAWADQMSRLESPSIAGQTSAFYAPGYSMFLVPMAWLSARGLFGPEFGAALVNVPLGVVTVGAVAWLAQIWFGRRAARIAAVAMAVAPSYVALTSIALSENLFTPLALLATVVLSLWARRRGEVPPRVELVALGAFLGFLYLVRNVGLVSLPLAVIVLRSAGLPWRRALRAGVPILVAAAVVIAPWGARNARDVRLWSPSSTSVASAFCSEHQPGANGWDDLGPETLERCYWGAPHLRGDEEARWYSETWAESLRYAAAHPEDEVVLIPKRLWWSLGQDRWIGAIEYTRVQSRTGRHLAPESTFDTLQWFADAWRWSTLGLAVLGLALVRRCRQAVPLWLALAAMLAVHSQGGGAGRFNHPMLVLVVPFAAAAVAALSRGDPGGPDPAAPTLPPTGDVPDRAGG